MYVSAGPLSVQEAAHREMKKKDDAIIKISGLLKDGKDQVERGHVRFEERKSEMVEREVPLQQTKHSKQPD